MAVPTTAVVEPWDRPDAISPSGWTQVRANSIGILSGQGYNTLANNNRGASVYVREGGLPNDQEVYVTVDQLPVAGGFIELLARSDVGSGTAGIRYELRVTPSTSAWQFMKTAAAVEGNIGSAGTQAFAAGDIMVFRVYGSVLEAWYIASGGGTPTQILTLIDQSIVSGPYIGVGISGEAATTAKLNDFGGGSIAVVPTRSPLREMLQGRWDKQRRAWALQYLLKEAVVPAEPETQVTATDTGSGLDDSVLAAALPVTDVGSGVEDSVLSATASASDTGSGSELAALVASLLGSDSGVGADSGVQIQLITVSDSGSGSDTSTLVAVYLTSDTGAGVDTSALAATYPVTDTGSGSELGALVARLTGSDTGAATDSAALQAILAVSDQGSGAENVLVAVVVPVSDSGAGADSSLLAVLLVPQDAGSGSDSVQLAGLLPVSDSGSGSDNAAVAQSFQVADSVTGTDLASMVAVLVPTDTGSGAEQAAIVAVLNAVDSGSGSDLAVAAATITVIDSGSGSDAAILGLALQVSDAGTGSDLATLFVTLSASDAGAGADEATMAASYIANEVVSALDTASLSALVEGTDLGTALESVVKSIFVSDFGFGIDEVVSLGRSVFDSGEGTDTAVISEISVSVQDSSTAAELANLLVSVTGADEGFATETVLLVIGRILAAIKTGRIAPIDQGEISEDIRGEARSR